MNDRIEFSMNCVAELSPAEVEAIKALLREYNRAANPELWAKFDASQAEPQNLHVAGYSVAGELIGGLLATTALSWLKINIMAVREDYRGQGLGAQLLQTAEQEAIRRDCQYSFLDTMDYQAPEFYRKCGYIIAGTIADWDSHGHTKYFFTKSLSS